MARDRTLENLKRRLERLELVHLRQHVAELAERLEAAELRAETAEREAAFADECATMWHREAELLRESLDDTDFATHRQIGLTKSGELLVVAMQPGGLPS